MRILFLDDEQVRHDRFKKAHTNDEITHVYTAEAAIEALKSQRFDLVSLDHDLGPDPWETGYRVACHLEGTPKHRVPEQIIIHSHNPGGSRSMHAALRKHELNEVTIVIRKPFDY